MPLEVDVINHDLTGQWHLWTVAGSTLVLGFLFRVAVSLILK